MTEFDAVFYDGKTSARKAVRVRSYARSLTITGDGIKLEVPLAQMRVEPPIAGTRRILHLPDGAQLQTDDDDAVRASFPQTNRLETWVHALEGRWSYALAAVAVAAAFSGWCVVYGLPLAASVAAEHVPLSIELALGEQTLAGLDKSVCDKSALDAATRERVARGLAKLTAGLDDGYSYQLAFRACKGMGANAFALPGGTIVVTDDLVRLAENDAQLTAVLAHEIGHVRHRHGVRLAIQAAGLAVLIATLAGDAVSVTGLAVTLPTALLQSGYSRHLEEEADTYAFQRLKEIGSSPKYFAQILERMEAQASRTAGGKAERRERRFGYLATHPATAERIERALKNQ